MQFIQALGLKQVMGQFKMICENYKGRLEVRGLRLGVTSNGELELMTHYR
jgi:hypothetical protein